MLSRYDQVICLWYEHFNLVHTIAKIMLTRIQRLFFDYLVDVLWIGLNFISSRITLYFFVELPSGCTTFLLPYYEIWAFIVVNKWILAYICQYSFSRVLFFLPIWYIIVGLLFLQSLKNHLIFLGNLDQFTFTSLPVKTLPLCDSRLWL